MVVADEKAARTIEISNKNEIGVMGGFQGTLGVIVEIGVLIVPILKPSETENVILSYEADDIAVIGEKMGTLIEDAHKNCSFLNAEFLFIDPLLLSDNDVLWENEELAGSFRVEGQSKKMLLYRPQALVVKEEYLQAWQLTQDLNDKIVNDEQYHTIKRKEHGLGLELYKLSDPQRKKELSSLKEKYDPQNIFSPHLFSSDPKIKFIGKELKIQGPLSFVFIPFDKDLPFLVSQDVPGYHNSQIIDIAQCTSPFLFSPEISILNSEDTPRFFNTSRDSLNMILMLF